MRSVTAAGVDRTRVVDVWWARTGRRPWRALASWLDAGERGRLEALRREADQERFVLAAVLARAAVASRLGVRTGAVVLDRTCNTCGAPHGKPTVTRPSGSLELSITHSGTVVGVAVGGGMPVGLDVEERSRSDIALLERSVLAPGERQALDRMAQHANGAPDRVTAFLQLWTRKEAITKMVGVGIAVPFSEVVVSGPDEPPRCLSWPDTTLVPDQVGLHDLEPPAPLHLAALAVRHPAADVVVGDGDALLDGTT